MTLHREVFEPGQAEAVHSGAKALGENGGVLAGGLSCALRFAHRRSHDIDWFLPVDVSTEPIADRLQSQPGVILTAAEPGTIHGTWHGVPFSVIRYRYRLVAEKVEGLPLADVRSLVSMKLLAVLNRGTKRDLVDIATFLDHGASLLQMIEETLVDIPGLAAESLLRALAYHDDAEKDPDPAGMAPGGWQKAKHRLATAVRDCLT